jgi:xanthine dehydrogenase accessory factor
MNNYYRHLLDLLANNKSGWSATVTKVAGSSPGSLGQKMLIEKDNEEISGTIGGGNLEYHVIDIIRREKPNRVLNLSYSLSEQAELGMVCGGDVELIVEPINVKERVIIFGAGHCAQALATILTNLNFQIVIYDNREEWLNPDSFPDNTKFINADFADISANIRINSSDYLAVMTYGHEFDNSVTEQVIDFNCKYLGVMGSKSKAEELKTNLAKSYSPEMINKIHCPIGLPINSHTPYEIAISIAGELIKVRNML